MKCFEVFYYDLHVGSIWATDRTMAVKQMGVRWGGMVGITLR